MEYEAGQYDIWARNNEFERLDVVSDYNKLILDLKWDEMSTWSLVLPTKEYIKRWQLNGLYGSLLVPPSGAGVHGAPFGIIVIRNQSQLDEAILTGIIVSAERKYDGFTDTVTLSGECDTSFMRTRDIWPNPTGFFDPDTHWWSPDGDVASDDVDGPCESCIAYYTNYNLGSWALPDRQLSYFATTVDQERGEQVQYQGRFQNLFDACIEILHSQPTTPIRQSFNIKQVSETASTRLLYNWREPVDKINEPIFGTEFGTISSFDYIEMLPTANYILVGGPNYTLTSSIGQTNDTTKRMYTDILNVTSSDMYGRREAFADYGGNVSGDTGTAAQELAIMADMQTQALKEASEQSYAMSATVTLLPFEGPEFMNDWKLGDEVSVDIGATPGTYAQPDHLQFVDIIREVVIEVSPDDGERITPTICDSMKFSRSAGTASKRAAASAKTIRNMGGKQR